jgi:alkanesulfonate monooxygenase SsuD/methylene tetrahydromethanopterin reductase-like flavin-dependent oxidoreductase (luciferase family)/predicted kinase
MIPSVQHPTPTLPDPALIVLVGASGAGKSAWAAARFARHEVVSSDELRAIIGSGEHDLSATDDAFTLLDTIAAARSRRRLTTVVDTLGLDRARRRGYLSVAREMGLPAVAVIFATDAAECRRRNRGRDRPVPAAALTAQLRRMSDVPAEIADEGWDLVLRVAGPTAAPSPAARSSAGVESPDVQMRFVLQIARFPWGDDPAGWLTAIAQSAADAGFYGLALMDHLIQIPQVGRAWEPIPEPWVTLGLLAGLPTSLRLGTLVSPASLHSAGRLAKTAATLDVLTGGRAFCGVGAGWWAREHGAFGLPFPAVDDRVQRLETTLETMRALWHPGTKAYHGTLVSLPETTCYPRPVGPLPLIVGGKGPRVLSIAARLADACNVPSDLDSVSRAVAAMGDREVTVLDIPVMGRDREQVATLVERLRGRQSAADYAQRHHAATLPDHVTRYRDLASRGVRTVFLALPDLAGPDEVERAGHVVAAFR